ncbi:MAG TPA: sulfur carrier protein ThiS [Gemmatimonadales bacterium]|jgi:thiamine biosynthesis protein ThiS|nr:sulfur carrier protein ThiS [Gemmatimonadales bacterium]
MELVINGDRRDILKSTTVEELLAELGLDARAVVVEHNRVIIRRPSLASTRLAEGDQVEIVHFVGGG